MNNHSTATISVHTGVKTKTGGLKDLGINPDPQGLQKLLWTEIEIKLRTFLKSTIEEMLSAELEAHIGAKHYERSERRRTYRNGSYGRSLGTMYGTVPLNVPRPREDSIEYHLFDQYARRGGSIDQAIGTLFMNGVSTRKLARIAKDIIGVDLSPSTVSRIETTLGDEDLMEENQDHEYHRADIQRD